MAGALELVPQKAVVEARVVGDEKPPLETLLHFRGDLGEGRRLRYHRIRDPGQALDEARNRGTRIDQAGPFAHAVLIDLDNADFGNAVGGCRGAGSFKVDKSQGGKGHGIKIEDSGRDASYRAQGAISRKGIPSRAKRP